MTAWTKSSWRNKKALQQPVYDDRDEFETVFRTLGSYPPLVSPGEVEKLQQQVARAGRGEAFILQGGDCAERFIDCNESAISDKIKILLQMSLILTYAARMPVVRIGRIAGQYMKPRSKNYEKIHETEIPIYRGDGINDYRPVSEKRRHDPVRLLQSFYASAVTLNYIRAIITGGFADIRHPHNWDLRSIKETKAWERYNDTLERILDALHFTETFGGLRPEATGGVDFYTSHEGLVLSYEEALTKHDAESDRWYNLGAHMLWMGDRTRGLEGAHVEYFRGISNPIGIKTGPDLDPDEISELLNVLNPEKKEGKITLITRLGFEKVEEILPPFIKKIKADKHPVTWCCDPMHGNLIKTAKGQKTRKFDDILKELRTTFLMHKSMGSNLGGVHFELTGENVTECVGGSADISDHDLHINYQSYCDPRLNYTQSLEMAFFLSDLLSHSRS